MRLLKKNLDTEMSQWKFITTKKNILKAAQKRKNTLKEGRIKETSIFKNNIEARLPKRQWNIPTMFWDKTKFYIKGNAFYEWR